MIYTDEFIEELINCEKLIIDEPEQSPNMRGSSKTKFTMESLDKKYNFLGFISQNLMFQENFSIGLVYKPTNEKGTIVLMRINGIHGHNSNIEHHRVPHIHFTSAERINNGLRPEGVIETNVNYLTREDAVQEYIKIVNLTKKDRILHFLPSSNQLDLFSE